VNVVNSSEQSLVSNTAKQSETLSEPLSPPSKLSNSMGEYYKLKHDLLTTTIVLSGFIFGCVWWFYSLSIALNYLLGACMGVVYVQLLAKNVERLGDETRRLGKSHLAVFIGLMTVATRFSHLQVLPVFLGFLTFKVTLLIYVLQAAFASNSS
jgi:ATP synthase protein I